MCGVKTASATAAERFSRASASSFVMRPRGMARSFASTTMRRLRAAGPGRVDGDDEVALLAGHGVAALGAGALDEVAQAARQLAEPRLERLLEVGALGRAARSLLGASARRLLERLEALVQAAELVGHLGAELVERAAGAGRVEQRRQPRAVAVEVPAEELVGAGRAPSLARPSSNRSPTSRLSLPESPR